MTPPSPELFFNTTSAYQRTASLKAAIEIGLFTAIGAGATDVPSIARQCKASERGVRILSDCLTVWGFLTKSGHSYALTPDSAFFLDRKSAAYLGGTLAFLNTANLMAHFDHLTDIVRTGSVPDFGSTAPDHPMWVDFARAMAPLTTMPAQAMAEIVGVKNLGSCKVLDIAAGHGMFGIVMAKANPAAQIIALDWAAVLEVAKENAAAAGVADRFHTIPGSAFDADYGAGYQIVLITNFLHHFDVPTCEKLLKRVHAALAPGGVALTLEFVPDDDRVNPPGAAVFSMMMLGSTPSGDAYTFREFDAMFRNSGFAGSETHQLPGRFQSVILSRK